MNVEEAIRLFLFHCQYEKNLTAKTLQAYGTDLRQFRAHLRRRKLGESLQDIGKETIRDYLQSLYAEYKPLSIKRKIATLKAIFTYLELEDIFEPNPFRKLRIKVDKERRLPRTLDRGAVANIFACAYEAVRQAAPGTDAHRFALRDVAVLETLFETGMRVSEVSNLRTSCVNLDTATLRIMGKGRKERVVPLCSAPAREALAAYAKAWRPNHLPGPHFFRNNHATHLTDQSIRALVKKYATKAHIPHQVTPHMFRHTIATLLLENGVDIRNIQYLLGHSSISVTERYVQVSQESQRKILNTSHPRTRL